MARPKANTPEGRRATEKWRKTMLEKYGSEEAFKHVIKCMGSLGGRVTGRKGFALNPELAKKAGAKGGRKSRRTGVTTGQGKTKKYYYNGDRKTFTAPETVVDPEPTTKKRLY